MKQQTFFKRLFIKILKRLGIIEEYKIDKETMCRKSVESGVCPNACDVCAWNSQKD